MKPLETASSDQGVSIKKFIRQMYLRYNPALYKDLDDFPSDDVPNLYHDHFNQHHQKCCVCVDKIIKHIIKS